MTSFKDHFSGHAAAYAAHRPHYPAELFAAIAAAAPARDAVWDVGCGNGQASVALAEEFETVFATDASSAQIGAARAHPHIQFTVAPAEVSGLGAASVSAITVAQALHWFDVEAFHREVRRVGRPGALLVEWCYGRCDVTPAIDAVVGHFYDVIVGPYWPPERRLLEAGYRDLPFPFEPVSLGSFAMVLDWNLEAFLAYLGTWSATTGYQKATGSDPLPALRRQLAGLWGESPRRVRWPLALRSGRL